MAYDEKKTLMVPVAGIVEACLDYSVKSNTFAMRIESLEQRLVIISDEEGAKPFLAIFDGFVDSYLKLREAELDL